MCVLQWGSEKSPGLSPLLPTGNTSQVNRPMSGGPQSWRQRGGPGPVAESCAFAAAALAALTAMHCRMMQLCFIRPGPPNFFMSLQKWHSPHSVRRQASHLRHRVRRLRAPAVVLLAANFTAEAGPSLPLGRPTARFCGRTDRMDEMGGYQGGRSPRREVSRLSCISQKEMLKS